MLNLLLPELTVEQLFEYYHLESKKIKKTQSKATNFPQNVYLCIRVHSVGERGGGICGQQNM